MGSRGRGMKRKRKGGYLSQFEMKSGGDGDASRVMMVKYVVEARETRNLAVFMNHAAEARANVMVLMVRYGHDSSQFSIPLLLAKRDIVPGEELVYSYGEHHDARFGDEEEAGAGAGAGAGEAPALDFGK